MHEDTKLYFAKILIKFIIFYRQEDACPRLGSLLAVFLLEPACEVKHPLRTHTASENDPSHLICLWRP